MQIKYVPITLIIIGILSRILPHPPNFVPITGIALFAGVYLSRKNAFIIPLVTYLISDAILGFYGWSMIFVYLGLILQIMIGINKFWKDEINRWLIGVGALLASIAFFIVSNFGSWLSLPQYYSRDFQGIVDCYVAALPFFRNSLVSDIIYTMILFGGYELVRRFVKNRIPKISGAF